MLRLLILLVGMLSTRRPRAMSPRSAGTYGYAEDGPDDDGGWFHAPVPERPPRPYGEPRTLPLRPGRRPRVPRKLTWAAVLVLATLIFRKAIAWAALTALGATLHLVGFNVHLPHVSFGWPWQSVSAGTTTDTDVGPWVLQKIQGISRPALGTENFNFTFTHKVSKSIGIWPCWYSGTFATVGHASATVDLNPGPALVDARVRAITGCRSSAAPATGAPGRVKCRDRAARGRSYRSPRTTSPSITRCRIRLTCSTAGTLLPGLGCGCLIRPQFSVSVLYAQAQSLSRSRRSETTSKVHRSAAQHGPRRRRR